MSAGNFARTAYTSDLGLNFGLRCQPETLTATFGGTANQAVTPTRDEGLPSVLVNGGKRQSGVIPRSVSFVWTGTPPTGYQASGVLRLPVPSKTVWDGIAIGQAVTYLGATGEVIGKSGEEIN